MIILLEGPDGAGKSTLAEKLSKRFDALVHHSSRPLNSEQLRRNMNTICDMDDSIGEIIIVDRAGWISEFVYSRAMFREQMLSTKELLSYHNRIQIVIYCTAEDYNIVEGKEHKPPEYMKRLYESHSRIVDEYEVFFSFPRRFPILRYNYQIDDYSDLVMEIEKCVDSLR
jgi:hypothetical protein